MNRIFSKKSEENLRGTFEILCCEEKNAFPIADVVFGESAGGGLKIARAMSKTGNACDVLELPFYLDEGPIGEECWERERKAFWKTYFCSAAERIPDNRSESAWEKCMQDLQKLLQIAEAGEKTIRIWYSDAPHEICGFYHVCWLLRSIETAKITAVRLPSFTKGSANKTIVEYQSWDEASTEFIIEQMQYARLLTETEKQACVYAWKRLLEDNAALRGKLNGKLVSLPEDFYDNLIWSCVPEGEFNVGMLVCSLLNYQFGISDVFWLRRIRAMVDAGRLIETDDRKVEFYYERALRKA